MKVQEKDFQDYLTEDQSCKIKFKEKKN